MALLCCACGEHQNEKESVSVESEEEKTEGEELSGTWVNEEGWTLTLDYDCLSYAMRSPSKLTGRGDYLDSEEGLVISYDGIMYQIISQKNHKIRVESLYGSVGSLSGLIFEKDDSANFLVFDSNELQGKWLNDQDVLIALDTFSGVGACFQNYSTTVKESSIDESEQDSLSEETEVEICDDFDGKGPYLLINDRKAYIVVQRDKTIRLIFEDSSDDSLFDVDLSIYDGKFKRVSYSLDDIIEVEETSEAQEESESTGSTSASTQVTSTEKKMTQSSDTEASEADTVSFFEK